MAAMVQHQEQVSFEIPQDINKHQNVTAVICKLLCDQKCFGLSHDLQGTDVICESGSIRNH